MNDSNPTQPIENSMGLPAVQVFHPAVQVAGGQVRVTSRQVAEDYGKLHLHVLEKVRNLDCSEAFRESNFRFSSYFSAQGKEMPLVEMTRDGFMFLTSRFTGPRAAQILEAYIAEFNRMEALLRGDGAQLQLAAVMQTMQALAAEVVALRHDLAELTQTHQVRLLDSQAELIELLKRHQKPQRRPLKAMTPEAHALIEQLLAEGMPGAEIARLVECSQATVSLIKHGRYQHSGHAGVPRREGDKQMPLIPEVEVDSPLD